MFSNRSQLATGPDRETALDCMAAAIEAGSPEEATRSAVDLDG